MSHRRWSFGLRTFVLAYVALLVYLAITLVGCASPPKPASPPKLYVEAALTYSFPFSTDIWVHQDAPWQCEPPGFDLELGIEWDSGVAIALYHESMLLCGTWNSKPEVFENGVRISKRWGGQ